MSTTVSDENFEAQITSALASLEDGAAAHTDEVIAKHLLEADGADKSVVAVSVAEIDFIPVKVITLTH